MLILDWYSDYYYHYHDFFLIREIWLSRDKGFFLRRRPGRQPEEKISHARTVLSPRFLYFRPQKKKKYLAIRIWLCEDKLIKRENSSLPVTVRVSKTRVKTKIKMKRAASRAAQSPKLHQSFGDCATSLILGQQADQYRATISRAHVYSGVFFGKPPGKPGAGLPIGSRTQVKSFLLGGGGGGGKECRQIPGQINLFL